MSCSSQYLDPMGFSCANNSTLFNYYYTAGPEYVHDQNGDDGQELIFYEDVTQCSVNTFFMPYNNDEESDSLDSSYHTDIDYQYSNCSLMTESPMSDMDLSPATSSPTVQQLHPEQISFQIQRNEELARLLSPIRKCQEQMQSQQTRKNAENSRRKFSLTHGIRPKQRQMSLNSVKPAKLSVSVRRWQSEILSKLPQQQGRQKCAVAPNVNLLPLNQQDSAGNKSLVQYNNNDENYARPPVPQRRSSLQVVPEWKQEEEYYCSSR